MQRDPLKMLAEHVNALKNRIAVRENEVKRVHHVNKQQAQKMNQMKNKLREAERKTQQLEQQLKMTQKQLLEEKRKLFELFNER